MRIYLDQMLKAGLAEILRSERHDVVRAEEVDHSRTEDDVILDFAVKDNRVLVTLDEDFGDWAILPLVEHPGVIREKVHPPTTEGIAKILVPLLARREQEDFRNRLVILTTRNVRWIQTAP